MITTGSRFVVAMMVGFSLLLPPMLAAHCDTMGGPVIADAKIALETRDLTPALKWVKPEHEGEIRAAFTLTLKARAQGPKRTNSRIDSFLRHSSAFTARAKERDTRA
jgi:hypothetical protein